MSNIRKTTNKIRLFLQKSNNLAKQGQKKISGFINLCGKTIAQTGISANIISVAGFLIGISSVNFLALNMYGWALVCIIANRIFDALDGAVARHGKSSEFGIFLDAALDYIFYAGVIFGFSLADPAQNAVAASFLLFAFMASACTMLAYAVIAYRRRANKKISFDKSPFYLGGFAQGAETFIAITIMCLLPFWFMEIAIILGILCFIKTVSIMAAAYYNFVIAQK